MRSRVRASAFGFGTMKRLIAALAFCLWPAASQAMVVADTRVLSVAELEARGISIEVTPPLGQTDIYSVRINIRGGDTGDVFQSMEMDIAERSIDTDFISTDVKKAGIRDSKRWAKIVRDSSKRKKSLSVTLARGEVPRCYIKFVYRLPVQDGIAVLGWFYCVLSEVVTSGDAKPPSTHA